MTKKTLLFTALFLSLLFTVGNLYAQGFLFPDRRIRTRFERFELKSQQVKTTIEDQAAVTSVRQVFYNPNRHQMEAEYIFVLPENSVATKLYLWMNGKKVKGELLDKDRARRIYQSIVSRMKDPALLEYMGRNLFRARIFPIPPRGEQKIEIQYHQQLPARSGVVEFRYPLRAKTYCQKPIENFSIDITLKSRKRMKSIYCPTHKLDINKKSDHYARISFEKRNFKSARDLQMFYTLSNKEFGLNLLTYRPDEDEDGYFMLLLAPKSNISRKDVQGKDLVFVLDRSGSMNDDDKFTQALKALKFGINNLNEQDQFNVITFSTEENIFSEDMVSASKGNKRKAINWLKKAEATGGTNIYDALKTALGTLAKKKKNPQIVVFITDGLPTVGETDIKEIIKMVEGRSSKNMRIFCFGLGFDVNTHLLDLVASKNRGTSDYVKPKENIEVAVSSFFQKITYPVLTDLEIDFGRIDISRTYPKDLPDLFKGSQLVLYGRYDHSGSTSVTLKGAVSEERRRFVYDAKFAEEEEEHEFIAYLWASRRIGHLLDAIRLHGENDELKEEVVRLSKKFGIVTPYTSYLVTEDEEIESPIFRRNRLLERKRSKKGTPAMPEKDLSFAPPSGEAAVTQAKELRKIKEESTISDDNQAEEIKHIGNKTFYLRSGVWVDSEYSEKMTTTRIKFGSAEYFDLVQKKVGISKYLSLGSKMIIVYQGKAYEIYDDN